MNSERKSRWFGGRFGGWSCTACGRYNPDEDTPCVDRTKCCCGAPRPGRAPNAQNLPLDTADGSRIRAAFSEPHMVDFTEIEERITAKLVDMESRGIVKRVGASGWTVLDQERYYDEMGIYGPGAVE